MKRYFFSLALAGLLLTGGAAVAQLPPLDLPQASPEASVFQQVGLTDITIKYNRPAVNKRKVWGELVPYGQVWRAGANLNTTIEFSSPVSIGGKTIPAGTYGLHMLPTESNWTVILSSVSLGLGQLQLRREGGRRPRLRPRRSRPSSRSGSSTASRTRRTTPSTSSWRGTSSPSRSRSRWTPTPSCMASLQAQLRGLPRFGWQAWNNAAQWSLQHDIDLDQGLKWADQSIQTQTTFANLRTKAAILEKKGDTKQAEDAPRPGDEDRDRGRHQCLRLPLLGQKKYDEAIAVFRKNIKDYPNSWNCYDSLGEALAAKGDTKASVENYRKALSMTSDPTQKKRIEDILAKMKA